MVSTAISRIDGVSTSVAVKAPVHAVATTNITLSGLQTIGGVTLDGSTLYRVLLTGQTDTTQNGIYDASTGSWKRSDDFDGEGDVVKGTIIVAPVSSPMYYYRVTSANPVIPGTSAITFSTQTGLDTLISDLASGVANLVGSTALRYERTQAEIDEGIFPANYRVPSHDVVGYIIPDRYEINAVPAGTDMADGVNKAHRVARRLTQSQLLNYIEVRLLPKVYYISIPWVSYTGVDFNLNGGQIYKPAGSTTASTLTSNLVSLDLTRPGDVSGNINCIGLIDDAIRADKIKIRNGSMITGAANSTTSPVDHGVVINGASNCVIENLEIDCVAKAGVVSTVCFMASWRDLRVYKANQAVAVENGTSIDFKNCYAVNCHKYGFYIRDVKYTNMKACGVDSLNNVSNSSDYTDRSIDSTSYVFDACYGIDATNNGSEQCFGTWVKFKSCEDVEWSRNVCIGPQSSSTGAQHVAIYYVDTLGRRLSIKNNHVMRSGTTALQGAANASLHHDFYSTAGTNLSGLVFSNNYIGNNLFDAPSAIYGNNVPSYIDSTFVGAQLAGVFTPALTMTTATGVSISYGASNVGRFSIVNGFMHVDCFLHASSITFGGAIGFIGIDGLPVINAAADQADLIVTRSAGITWPSTEGFFLTVDAGFKNGLIQNRTRTVALGTGAYVSGATDVKLHCSGSVPISTQFS